MRRFSSWGELLAREEETFAVTPVLPPIADADPRIPAIALLGCEPRACVETDRPAVQHRVLDDRDREFGVLFGPAHAPRERGVVGQAGGHLLGHALHEPGAEQARRDR